MLVSIKYVGTWNKDYIIMDSTTELSILIFSKDRAAQLDCLLRSLSINFKVPYKQLYILYTSSNNQFWLGYERVKELHTSIPVRWIREISFKNDLIELTNNLNPQSNILFLVDDDIFFREFSNQLIFEMFSPQHLFISLRCSRNYVHHYPPHFISERTYLEWEWNYQKKKRVKWNYPFSVDGHVFHTGNMQKILRKIEFKAPNSLEGRMHRYRHAWWIKRKKKALAPLNAVVINNPLNSVQSEGETWNRGVSSEVINERFLNGKQISLQPAFDSKPDDVHYSIPLIFE